MFPTIKELNNKKLQSFIERVWVLHDKLNNEIKNSINFYMFCSDLDCYCDIGQTPVVGEGLIAIKDSQSSNNL